MIPRGLVVSPVECGLNFLNFDGTRLDLIPEMVPFDGEVMGVRLSKGYQICGNGKACCIVSTNGRLKLSGCDGELRVVKPGAWLGVRNNLVMLSRRWHSGIKALVHMESAMYLAFHVLRAILDWSLLTQ